jgi:hypothetical protein
MNAKGLGWDRLSTRFLLHVARLSKHTYGKLQVQSQGRKHLQDVLRQRCDFGHSAQRPGIDAKPIYRIEHIVRLSVEVR